MNHFYSNLKLFLVALFAFVGVGAWADEVTDKLDQSVTGVSGTTYTDFSDKTVSSDAVYAGQCAGSNESIQLRSKNSNSGVITTKSGGTAKKIVVTWESHTAAERVLSVYGSNTAYTAATDLYDEAKQGTLIGDIAYAAATEGVSTLEIEDEYAYIGFRSKDGAMYLTSVEITWETGAAAPSVAKPTLPASTTFFGSTSVEITAAEGAAIYYTLDGTDPTAESTAYTEALTITETTTVKAIAVVEGVASAVASATYTAGPSYATLAAANAAATSERIVSQITLSNALVTYVNGQNTYVKDATGGFLIYGTTNLTAGDIVNGTVQGQLYTYKGLPEMANPTLQVEVASSGNEVAPVEVDAAALAENPLTYISQYVVVMPAVFAEDAEVTTKTNVNFTVGETALIIRNNFTVEFSVEAAKIYSVAGLVTIYNEDVQLYPTAAADIAEYVAPATYAITIADIENGAVEADKATAVAGETVTLTIHPAEGYELDVLSVKAGDETIAVEGNTFTMPEAEVTVTATFKKTYVPEFSYEKYLIKNVGAGLYWGAGNDWGTRASLVKHPEYVKLVPQAGENIYQLESQVNNGGTSYYFNGDYMDNGSPVNLTVTKLENGNYTIAAADGGLYGYDGTSTILGKALTAEAGQNVEWTIVSLADAKAALANATVEAPMDATLLIEDHDFGRNNRYVSKWTMEASNQNLSGGNDTNNCAESYHATFTLSQVLEGAPAGVYAMTAQGFYRQDGTDNDNLPYFYANDEKQTFPAKTGSENSMSNASVSFSAGLYTIDPIWVKVEEGGTLTIGAKLETNTALWCIFDNFVLTYYGDCDIADAKFAGLVAQVKALKAEAEELKAAENVSEPTVTALEAAIDATAEIEATEEAYNTVIAALTAAVDQAKKDVANKSAINAMYAVIESTNFYTADALATYKAEADGYKEAWEAGTLTATVDNPATVHAWHAGNSYDNLLLSAWTINDVQCDEFATALYINTWSVEGETDGTEFKVPFFEYWTGDGESLAANTLSAKLTEMEAGYYDVTAWVRVRAKNGVAPADATGITAAVNGGAAVDVTEGTVVENSQFSLAEYTVRGKVGEDGILTFSLNVAADNNISWLSFKNVKYTKVDATSVYYDNALAAIEDGGTYRVFTEVDDTKLYLNDAGKLVNDPLKAATFTFAAVNAAGTLYPTGWNLGKQFTNPSLTGGSTGDVVQKGGINVGGNNRDDWERQVFFLNDEGKYAVRATNANSANWGANTYWDVVTYEELPAGGYSLEPAYVWQIEANVDNRPEAFAKVQTWLPKLHAIMGGTWTTNAQESSEGPIANLTDGDINTHFHSQWSGTGPDEDHYIQANLPEAAEKFYLRFIKRQSNNNNRPTKIVVSDADGTEAQVITEGLPADGWYDAEVTLPTASNVVRLTVPTTNSGASNNGHVFFTFGECYLLPQTELTTAIQPYLNVADYTDLADEDVEPINTLAAQIDAAKAQIDLAADIEALKALADKLQAQVDATDTYEGADAAAAAAAAVTVAKEGTYLTKEELDAAKAQLIDAAHAFFAGITAKESIDITDWYVANAAPVANSEGWAVINGTAENQWAGNTYDAANNVAEFWNYAGSTIKQALTLPAGDYKLTAIALQRTDMTGYVFAGETQKTIATVSNDVVNNRGQAASWFAEGNGVNEVTFNLAEAGDIEIGITTDASAGDHWTVWQSFKLELVAPVPAVALNAPTFNIENGTQAEPNMLPAGSTLKINYSAENLEANGYKAEDLKVKVTVGVSGDLPENIMNMQSETVHRVQGEIFYIPLGETDFPVALKEGYVYQTVAVAAAQLVVPATEEAEEVVVAAYAGAPAMLRFVGIKKAEEPVTDVLELALNVERYPGLGYGVTDATVDFTEAKEFLGVEEVAYDMLRIVNPDGTKISDYAPFDGWFNAEGVATTWGDNTAINVKFFEAIPDGKFTICDMNGADEIGKTYTVKWALEANEKSVVYTINVTFVEKPVIDLTLADLNQVAEKAVEVRSELGNCYEGLTADVDVAAILTALQVESLDEVTIYAVQSDGSLDDMYQLGTTDGWRNAAGDFQAWGENAYFFVKADFTAESAQLYAIGGMEGKNTTADWETPTTYVARYAFVKDASDTHDAVILSVTLAYDVPVGIRGIDAAGEKATIYDLSGRKVEKVQRGGVYIINGKKVSIK